jgi:Uma2 family endonuclease
MPMVAPVYYTADMVRALPDDGNRYETVYGELLVTPAPRLWHQEIVARLFVGLRNYLEPYPAGHVLASPADISWSSDVLVQPDIFVADSAEVRSLEWKYVKSLQLVIEVLSPATTRYDRFTKRRLYQEVNVPTYWIVDPDEHAVEVWTPDTTLPRVEREQATWKPPGAQQPFVVTLSDLFRPI